MDCCLFKSCLAKSPNFSRHRSGVDFVDPAFCNRFFGGFRSSKLAFSSGFLGLSLDEGIGNYGSRVPHRGSVNVIIPFASAGLNERESDALATPLVMQSSPGKFLNEVLQNQPHLFTATAAEQLEQLAEERNGAVVRKRNSAGTDECLLHRNQIGLQLAKTMHLSGLRWPSALSWSLPEEGWIKVSLYSRFTFE